MIKLSRPELSLCVCLQIWNQSGAGHCASVYCFQYFLINQSYFSVVLGVAAVISPYQRRCTGEILRNSPDIGELQPCLFSSFNQKLSTKCKLYAFLVSLLQFGAILLDQFYLLLYFSWFIWLRVHLCLMMMTINHHFKSCSSRLSSDGLCSPTENNLYQAHLHTSIYRVNHKKMLF